MPSKSPAQRRLMAAAAHDPNFAAAVGIPVQTAQEFNKADQAQPKPDAEKRKMQVAAKMLRGK